LTNPDLKELRTKALALRKKGLSIPQIANELGIPRVTVYSWLPETDDKDGRFAKMVAMREQGMTNIEIAEHFGTSHQYVSKVLGPSVRRGRRADPRDRIQVRLESRDHETLVGLAENLGIRIPSGQAAGRGSINALLEEIARGRLKVAWSKGHTPHTHLVAAS